MGIAAALVAGALGRRGLAVALWAGAVGASAHAVALWMGVDLGWRSTDAPLLTAGAVVLVAGLDGRDCVTHTVAVSHASAVLAF